MKTNTEKLRQFMEHNQYFIGNDLHQLFEELIEDEKIDLEIKATLRKTISILEETVQAKDKLIKLIQK